LLECRCYDQGTVVLAGSLPVEHLALDLLVGEFGWSLNQASSLRSLAELNADYNVVAVLSACGVWRFPGSSFAGILDAAPKALPILCHGFADAIDWPQVAEAGLSFAPIALYLG